MITVKMQNQSNRLRPKITVVGVGGGGGNAVNNMIYSGLEGCEFLVCNTDAQALEGNAASHKIQLGVNVTRGLGAGANPEIGRAAAEESIDDILGYLDGSNMVFVTAGMGGGTGTGAASVIAQAAREAGILTIGVVTKPFHFEGTHRMKLAESGISDLQRHVDTLIVIPNQNLFRIANEKTTFSDAFRMADDVLQSGVRSVTDLMVMPGLINLDFADVRAVMAEMGKAMMGTGEGEGEKRAVAAAESAISNPLLDDISMKGARGVLINVIGSGDLTLFEVDEAVNRIREEVDPDANIIFGSTQDDSLEGRMRVSVVATGIDADEKAGAGRPAVQNLMVNTPNGMVTRTQTTTPQASNVRPAPQQPQQARYSGYAGAAAAGAAPSRAPNPTPAPAESLPASIIPQQRPTHLSAPQATASAAPQAGQDVQPDTPPQTMGHATPAAGYTQTATARKVEQAEQSSANWAPQNYQRTVPSPAQSAQPSTSRGTRVGDAFIPPRPATADDRGRPAPEADLFAQNEPAGLSAPAKQAPAPKPKKAPSLFERFTLQRSDKTKQQPAAVKTSSQQPALAAHEGGVPDEDDELDIPAFLRRQAN